MLVYTFGYAMELNCSGYGAMLFWNYFQYIAIPLLPAFWLIFCFQFSGKERLLTPKAYAFIYSVPALTFILRYTNDFHHLFYKKTSVFYNGSFNTLLIDRGIAYYLQFAYTTVIIVLTSILYLRMFFSTGSKSRSQALILFFSSIFPWAAFFIMVFVVPVHLDLAPFFLSFSLFLQILGFYKFNFLNIMPYARTKVFEWSKDGILILDDDYAVIDYNEKAKNIILTLGSKSIGENIKQYINGYTSITSAYKSSQESQFKISSDGTDYCYDVKCLKINNRKNKVIGYMVFLQDITELTNTLTKLNYYASTDALTGVYNRRVFSKMAEDEIVKAKAVKQPLSFMILDLDNFKKINDTYGHLAGDELVIHVSKILRENIRQQYLLGRYGGEEFIILLPDTAIEKALEIAEELRKKIEMSSVEFNDQTINVTASFGVSGTDTVVNEDLNTFLKYADKALYIAKNNGRNCVCVNNIG